MEKIIVEGNVTINEEDGGCALISDPIGDEKESGLFVRICSWDEDKWQGRVDTPIHHGEIEKLRDKKVRITIELIEE